MTTTMTATTRRRATAGMRAMDTARRRATCPSAAGHELQAAATTTNAAAVSAEQPPSVRALGRQRAGCGLVGVCVCVHARTLFV